VDPEAAIIHWIFKRPFFSEEAFGKNVMESVISA
jgi:hypothetical protein